MFGKYNAWILPNWKLLEEYYFNPLSRSNRSTILNLGTNWPGLLFLMNGMQCQFTGTINSTLPRAYIVYVDLKQDPCTKEDPFLLVTSSAACTQRFPLKYPCISAGGHGAVQVASVLCSYYTSLETISGVKFWWVVSLWYQRQGNSWQCLRRHHNVQPCDELCVQDDACTWNCNIWNTKKNEMRYVLVVWNMRYVQWYESLRSIFTTSLLRGYLLAETQKFGLSNKFITV